MKARTWQGTITVVICFTMLIVVMFSCLAFRSQAKDDRELSYQSIQIQKGDTLNAIAANHISAGFHSSEDFLYEINRINRLSDDIIHEGAYLIIPYYE